MSFTWKPYIPVAQRKRKAAAALAQQKARTGQAPSPVSIEGRKIALTFWGKAWCDNLESYSDYANRLPRGRTYVRNGSVVDLRLESGQVTARVSGSRLYKVSIEVKAMAPAKWKALCAESSGAIDSMVELLQGRFAKGVMERLCQPRSGLFPAPADMSFSCSCPDWASMCKHVAASLYGVGSRLDQSPELFFTLRQVKGADLIAGAGQALVKPVAGPAASRVLSSAGLDDLFGLDLGEAMPPPDAGRSLAKKVAPPARRKAAPMPPERFDAKAKAKAKPQRRP